MPKKGDNSFKPELKIQIPPHDIENINPTEIPTPGAPKAQALQRSRLVSNNPEWLVTAQVFSNISTMGRGCEESKENHK